MIVTLKKRDTMEEETNRYSSNMRFLKRANKMQEILKLWVHNIEVMKQIYIRNNIPIPMIQLDP